MVDETLDSNPKRSLISSYSDERKIVPHHTPPHLHLRMDELVRDVGAEEHLAGRIGELMRAAGLSQDALARKMAEVGTPIPQSAISKIIHPPRGGRRAITVDEALGFARVFDVELRDLLLPESAPLHAELFRRVGVGGSHLDGLRVAQRMFNESVAALSSLCAQQPEAEPLLRVLHADLAARISSGEDPTKRTEDEHKFLTFFLAAIDEERT